MKIFLKNVKGALGSLGRKGFDSVTPYMHCLVYHVPCFTKKYRQFLRLSGQGVYKKFIIQKETNETQLSMLYKFEKG